jgi:hypothetical protein
MHYYTQFSLEVIKKNMDEPTRVKVCLPGSKWPVVLLPKQWLLILQNSEEIRRLCESIPPEKPKRPKIKTETPASISMKDPGFKKVRMRILLRGLEMELKGMKRHGRSCYSIIKDEFNLKGNRQKVHDQLTKIITEKESTNED